MLCAISRRPPRDAVFCSKTGYLYDRPLIVAAIESAGECPLTHTKLTVADLDAVRGPSGEPPLATAETATVPSLLAALQTEWDSVVLEIFQLRQALEKTRTELALALFENDAAVRVVDRLAVERDQARAALVAVGGAGAPQPSNGGASALVETKKEDPSSSSASSSAGRIASSSTIPSPSPLTPEETAKLEDVSKRLSAQRKKMRKIDPSASVQSTKWSAFDSLDSSSNSVLAADVVCLAAWKDLVVVGLASPALVVLGRAEGGVTHALEGFRVADCLIFESPESSEEVSLLCACSDGNLRVYQLHPATRALSLSRACPLSAVDLTRVALHPALDFAGVMDARGNFTLVRIHTGVPVFTRAFNADASESTSAGFVMAIHPDGKMLGVGGAADGSVSIVSLDESGAVLAKLAGGHSSPVTMLLFAEDGTSVLSGESSKGSTIKRWDLRSHQAPVEALEEADAPVALAFEKSANLLVAVYSSGKTVFRKVANKASTWPVVKTLELSSSLSGEAVARASFNAGDGDRLVVASGKGAWTSRLEEDA